MSKPDLSQLPRGEKLDAVQSSLEVYTRGHEQQFGALYSDLESLRSNLASAQDRIVELAVEHSKGEAPEEVKAAHLNPDTKASVEAVEKIDEQGILSPQFR